MHSLQLGQCDWNCLLVKTFPLNFCFIKEKAVKRIILVTMRIPSERSEGICFSSSSIYHHCPHCCYLKVRGGKIRNTEIASIFFSPFHICSTFISSQGVLPLYSTTLILLSDLSTSIESSSNVIKVKADLLTVSYHNLFRLLVVLSY